MLLLTKAHSPMHGCGTRRVCSAAADRLACLRRLKRAGVVIPPPWDPTSHIALAWCTAVSCCALADRRMIYLAKILKVMKMY